MNDLISRQVAVNKLREEVEKVSDSLFEAEGSYSYCEMVKSISTCLDDIPTEQPGSTISTEEIKNIDELFSDNRMRNFRDLIINDPAVDENAKNKFKHIDANGMRWLLFLLLIGPRQTVELFSNESTAEFLKSQIFGNEED